VGDAVLSLYVHHRFDCWHIEPTMTRRDADFELFFMDNYSAVVAALTMMTGDRERSVDAAQEAFIKAYAKWSTIRSYDMPGAWVRRIAINASRDDYRSERRRRRRELPNVAAESASPAEGVVGDDFAQRLLASLPRRQREVTTLYYIDDRPVSEIATILGLNEGTVKSHLAEARERMRSLVGQHGADR
jgi:RNA polymerase sigma-70 factor (ECF subfamily)